MNNQKAENLLNLAVDTPPELRRKSTNLQEAYSPLSESYELIVKYNNSLDSLQSMGVQIQYLIAGYAILLVPESSLSAVLDFPNLEYAEIPKKLYFSDSLAKAKSCILPVTINSPFLSGEGTYTAIIDSGIDYTLPNFLTARGTTRIEALWDQSLSTSQNYPAPAGYLSGRLYPEEEINKALASENPFSIVPSFDDTGHGTAVAGIAASSQVDGYSGVAPNTKLIIVKLGNSSLNSFPRTTQLMTALDFVVKYAKERNRPIAINLSFGNNYGPHNGTSLLERFLDNISEIGRNVICVASGNEAASSGHYRGNVEDNRIHSVEFSVGKFEVGLNLQVWMDYSDHYELRLISPSLDSFTLDSARIGSRSIQLEETNLLCYVGEASPYSTNQEIYYDFVPSNSYINSGIWKLEIIPRTIKNGFFRLYLPSAITRGLETKFLTPNPDTTLTIPSSASRVIAVGAYDPSLNSYADFSGRGYENTNSLQLSTLPGVVRPTIVAPGVNILVPTPRGSYTSVSGTSFASPFVTGSAALMMEWGIVKNNDPFLYGEKVKASFIKGAKLLSQTERYPNNKFGFGALCLSESFSFENYE